MPWGSHICLFFETEQDLLDINIAYFRAALAGRERGLWILHRPLTRERAERALAAALPEFASARARGQLEIVVADEDEAADTSAAFEALLGSLRQWRQQALAAGFSGLRVSGTALWQHAPCSDAFCAQDQVLDEAIAGTRLLALCTYSLGGSRAREILDVARGHRGAIARCDGTWEILDAPGAGQAGDGRSDDSDGGMRRFCGRELLTPREELVLGEVVRGASSKQIARTLGISPRTVEFHRANAMQKLGAKNVAELVRLALG